MKPEELFIGAWVKYSHTEDRIAPYKESIRIGAEDICQDECVIDAHYEPIPLTPEILEKNGFEHRGRYYLIFDDPSLALKPELQGNRLIFLIGHLFDCNNFHAFIELQSVHELQAAIRLCGIEKEIIL